jgi:hypothetical protein
MDNIHLKMDKIGSAAALRCAMLEASVTKAEIDSVPSSEGAATRVPWED